MPTLEITPGLSYLAVAGTVPDARCTHATVLGVTISTLQMRQLGSRERSGSTPLSWTWGADRAALWTAGGLALTSVDTWILQDSGRVNVSNNHLV